MATCAVMWNGRFKKLNANTVNVFVNEISCLDGEFMDKLFFVVEQLAGCRIDNKWLIRLCNMIYSYLKKTLYRSM